MVSGPLQGLTQQLASATLQDDNEETPGAGAAGIWSSNDGTGPSAPVGMNNTPRLSIG